MGEAVLVFPAGMPEGLVFRDRARARGLRVVGASSLERDPAEPTYEAWEHLPYVNDPGFDDAFAEVVRRHDVSTVHAPHYIVWKHLSERLGQIAPGARLTTGPIPQDNERAYRSLEDRAAALKAPCFWPALPGKLRLTALQQAGLMRMVDAIPGSCGEEMMVAVAEAMRHAPAGDVVEIGAWWGRSAALLVWLARHYGVGKVLCVDPWLPDALAQGAPMLDAANAERDTEQALRIFEINLTPLAQGSLNYIRATSVEGAAAYRSNRVVTTEAFGKTEYAGAIAMLHIDGNHAEPFVAADAETWTPLVVPGGWIVFEDYEWAFGDGVKQVADAFVEANNARIACHFTAGAALFVQLKK
jgi:Methyltransferase domain